MAGDLRRTGRVSFKGQRLESERDLAVLGQVAADPQGKSFRIVCVKGPVVVTDEIVSSRLAGTTAIFVDPARRALWRSRKWW